MQSVFCSPSRYTQGRGATSTLGSEMAGLGLDGPVLIIAGRTVINLLSETWQQTFKEVGLGHVVHPFGGECSLAEIERVKTTARAAGAKTILGAGGGKVLDTARAVAADLGLPVVSCPTVASSDAPCSALSVIYTEEGIFQEYRFYRKNPELVLVDTEVIAQAPPRLLVAGMGDALATWFEARTCVRGRIQNMRGGGSTRSAAVLAELCYQTLLEDGAAALEAVRHQVVTPSLERLVEANTLLSGLGFESSGLAAAHAVHNGLTTAPATHRFFHGEKVAFGLLVQLVLEGESQATFAEVLGFANDVGLPTTLAEIGLPSLDRELLNTIAKRATAPGETIHNEPFEVTAPMVADAVLAADAYGRAWRRRQGTTVSPRAGIGALLDSSSSTSAH
jgi:glycerol dehydrogenase